MRGKPPGGNWSWRKWRKERFGQSLSPLRPPKKDGEEPAQGSANIPDEIVLKQDTVAKLKSTFKGLILDNLDGATTKFALRPLPLEFKCNKDPKLSTQWKYPMEWLKPLWWYWQQMEVPTQHMDPHPKGAVWLEILTGFELATRVMIKVGTKQRAGPSTVKERARSFAMASRRIFHLCGGTFPKVARVSTLVPLGARWIEGLSLRPRLVYPQQVMTELVHQALVHKGALAQGAPEKEHWKWQPIYRCMPICKWHASTDRIREAISNQPRRRLLHKRSWQAHCQEQRSEAPLEVTSSQADEAVGLVCLERVAKRLRARAPAQPSGGSSVAPRASRRATPY